MKVVITNKKGEVTVIEKPMRLLVKETKREVVTVAPNYYDEYAVKAVAESIDGINAKLDGSKIKIELPPQPVLSPVALTGSYNDLTDLPVLPTYPDTEAMKAEIKKDALKLVDGVYVPTKGFSKLLMEHLTGSGDTIVTYDKRSKKVKVTTYVSAVQASGGLQSITGLITAGTNVTITGSGTQSSPYVINSAGGGSSSGGAGEVQFSDGSGGFTSDSSFVFNTGTQRLSLKGIDADNILMSGNQVAIWGDNISIFTNDAGYLTANQTITLSGDVSGTGSTSISVTIGNDKVTFAKMQNIATSRILGRTTAGTGDIEELPIGAGIATFLATPSSANLASAVTDETGSGALVFANSPTLVTPALGTPSSGTLTNCTGLPVSGIASSTSTALGVGSLELGNASDTTLSRSAAGVLAVEGVVIPSISSTNTLTNKRITKRVGTTTSSATPTINTDNVDYYSLTAQTVDITSFTTNLSGTPTDNQTLWISITGTAARAITWGSSFESSTVTLPNTTVSTDRLDVGFVWNAATSKWRCVAVA